MPDSVKFCRIKIDWWRTKYIVEGGAKRKKKSAEFSGRWRYKTDNNNNTVV